MQLINQRHHRHRRRRRRRRYRRGCRRRHSVPVTPSRGSPLR